MRKNIVLRSLVSCLLLMSCLLYPAISLAEDSKNLDTKAGISFTGTNPSGTPDTPKKPVPDVPKSSIKKGGLLPQTGELLQPIMFILIGWLLVIIFIAICLSMSKTNTKEDG